MIAAAIRVHEGSYVGFTVSGHAGYDDPGRDIVCAAVSALTVNCVNSVESLAGDAVLSEEEEGYLNCLFPEGLSEGGTLLVRSMILGLRQISEISGSGEEDGKPFLNLMIEEV